MASKFFSREDIISRCLEATDEELLDGQPYGNKVLRLCTDVVVKFGWYVSEQEKRNQMEAYSILDHNIVRVPRVHDYFQDSAGCGYLVMEFLHGRKKDEITDKVDLQALSLVLQHFATRRSQRPGPLAGGSSIALIFGESDYPTFSTAEALDDWFSYRLLEPGNRICLSKFQLVLCHLDLFPRNILWHETEPPAVLDWSSAGYYPQVLERCAFQILAPNKYQHLFQPMTRAEIEQFNLVLKTWGNIIRFCFTQERMSTPEIWVDPDFVIPPPPIPPSPPYPSPES